MTKYLVVMGLQHFNTKLCNQLYRLGFPSSINATQLDFSLPVIFDM
jgi:hypothetical protein